MVLHTQPGTAELGPRTSHTKSMVAMAPTWLPPQRDYIVTMACCMSLLQIICLLVVNRVIC